MKSKFPSKLNVNLTSSTKTENLGWQDAVQERIKTLEYFVSSKIKTINGLIFRKGGRGLIGIILNYIRAIRPRSSKSVVKQVAGFVFYCNKIAKHSGLKGLVIYLKASQVLLQQSVGGFRVLDLGELKVRPSRNKAGVPLIIPAGVRVLISRDRHIPSIRLWMTLLGLYRILEFKGKLTLSTIISRGPNQSSFIPEWEKFLTDIFLPSLVKRYGKLPKLGNLSLFPILKAGPTTQGVGQTSSSGVALIAAGRIFMRFPSLLNNFKVIANNIGVKALFFRMRMVAMAWAYKLDTNYLGTETKAPSSFDWRPFIDLQKDDPMDEKFLGKLGFKPEPAGKVRVFAMVDAWTQWLLSPLHSWIFSILRNITEDGTFNQLVPIQKLQAKYAASPKKRTYASIDLSAATDRLPISLQESILKVLLKDLVLDSAEFAKNWSALLVKRPYKVSVPGRLTKDMIVPHNLESAVYYAVGQPMGALSSWAMLALTHHAMIQYSYYKAYNKVGWYEDYGVLGDDMALVDGKVILEYRRLLARLGVKAGLAKSILAKSKFVIEFAKKFFVDSVQANMLPFKECIATSFSTSLVLEFGRKYGLTLNQILSFLNYGYKVKIRAVNSVLFKLNTRLRVLLVWLSHPSSPIGKATYYEWLFQKTWKELHEVNPRYLFWLVDQCRALVDDKVSRMLNAFEKYQDSLNNLDKTLDKAYPIKIITSKDRGDYLETDEFLYSWRGVLNPDFSSQRDGDFWDDSFESSSSHGYRWQKAKEELQNMKLGIDFDEIYIPAFGKLQELYDNANGPLEVQLEELLKFYFEPDLISSRIPEKFWIESREKLRPFRDFLQIYKLWQDLTKPLWVDYYKDLNFDLKLLDQPDDELSLFEWSFKLKKKFKFNINDLFPPERGEQEGKNQPVRSLWDIFKETIWPIFVRIVQVVTLIVEWGIVLLFILFIDSIDSNLLPSPKLDAINGLDSNVESRSFSGTQFNYWNILYFSMMAVGVLLILTDPNGLGGILWSIPDIVVTEVTVQGPMTLGEYEALQRVLENQALLDNLAMSPIGDLWISPWD